jgi:hypothetical protein
VAWWGGGADHMSQACPWLAPTGDQLTHISTSTRGRDTWESWAKDCHLWDPHWWGPQQVTLASPSKIIANMAGGYGGLRHPPLPEAQTLTIVVHHSSLLLAAVHGEPDDLHLHEGVNDLGTGQGVAPGSWGPPMTQLAGAGSPIPPHGRPASSPSAWAAVAH